MTDTPRLALQREPRTNTWSVRITWPGDRKRRRLSLGVPADEDPTEALEDFKRTVLPTVIAERKAEREAEAREQGPQGHKQGPKLQEMADWFLRTWLPASERAGKTQMHYARTLESFIAYMSSRNVGRAAQVGARMAQEWAMEMARQKNRPRPSRDELLAVRYWFERCANEGDFAGIPTLRWNIPGKTKSKRFKAYPRDVLGPWLDALEAWRPRAGLVARWVDATGWRIGDALDLRAGEIDRERGEINRAQLKTDAELLYPLSPHLLELLDRALQGRAAPESADHVFLDPKGQPWEYHKLQKTLDYFHSSRWDGPKITFRDLRKSFASRLAMEGCPPNVLKELLGHADISLTLSYYVQVDRERMAEWLKKSHDG